MISTAINSESDHSSQNDHSHYQKYCESESNEAYTLICKSQEEYDKQLLTLSTGMLAVLFAFLKDLVHLDDSIYLPVLYIGLGCLALTIAIVIFSFQLSIRALEEVRAYWKEQYDGNYEKKFPDQLSNIVRLVNRAAGIMFILGISLALLFILINLSHQTKVLSRKIPEEISSGGIGTAGSNLQTGGAMAKGSKIANDGALTKQPIVKAPTSKVTSGYVPKAPIGTGSNKK